ncbi:MAG: class I SAM-dependent methyltransferase [Longimicrobiaceae bacterium]
MSRATHSDLLSVRSRRAWRLTRKYGFAAGASLYLFSLGFLRERNRTLINSICQHFGYTDREVALPSVELHDLVPDCGAIRICAPEVVEGNVTLLELVAINKLVSHLSPRRLFEIGTFDGRTTLNLAVNSPEGAEVFTLDLPRTDLAATALPVEPSERIYIEKDESGARYRGSGYESKITQLYGDSALFDFSPFRGSIDFVFIDGSHAYEYVLTDSRNALRMLSGTGGIILWHDYGGWDGVTRALNELYHGQSEFGGLRRLAGTSLALLQCAGGSPLAAGDRLG